MEQLKKHGYTTGRGKLIGAHAEGTVNAFKSGTGTKINLPNLKDVTANNRAVQHAKNAAKETSEAVSEKAEEEKEAFEEIFDWIDRRIKNFQRKFDKWLNQAETALTSGFITKYYKKAAKSLSKELKTYGKAYNRYMKEANSSQLSRKYKKKVKNGTIDIENIKDEKLADKIKKYQEYYDKAIDSTTSFVETAEKLYNLPLDKAAAKIEKFSDALDLLDKKMDNAIGSKAKNRLVDQQTIQKKNTLDANAAASREAQNNLAKAGANLLKSNTLKNSGVSAKEKKAIKNAVKNGTEINLAYFKEGSNGYNAAVKYNEALKANAQAVYDLQTAQEEYASWLVESAKIKFDNIADDYEKQIQMIGHQMTDLENKMSEIETRGKKVNKAYYESQRSINIQTIEQLKKERAELEQSLKGIKQGSDEWYDAYDKIKQIDSDISGKIRDNYDNVNKINQLYFDLFEDISESIGRIITEQEFLQGLFAHEKLSDDKTGNLTEAGLAKLGSLSASYYASKNNAERDTAALKELLEVRDKGKQADGSYQFGNWEFNSLEDLEDRIDEFYTKTQNDIKEEYRLKSEIADLMKEKYQAELDMLKELIDAKKDALNAEKDLHDYQKSIQEKTDSISTIQKQIAAYSGDTSQEGMAKLQKLQKDLAEKQDDLKETEYDRYISDQQDMLDKLYEEYEELVTKKLEDFMALVEEGLALADKNTAAIYDFLKGTADTNGYLEETKGLFDGLSGTIKENADRIIEEMAKKKTSESGTEPETPAAPAAPPTPDGTSGTAQNNTLSPWAGHERMEGSLVQYDPNTSQGNTVIELNNKSYRENVKRFINNNAHPAQKARNKYSAVNKKIYDNASNSYSGKGKVLSENDLKNLSTQLNVTYNGAGEKKNLYQKLKAIKFPGFKKGGIVSVDDIEKQVKQNGDDGIASVKNGESILTPVQTDLFKKFTEHMPELTAAVDMSNLVKIENPIEHLRDLSNARSMNNVVNIDNITLPNVTNAEEFADTLIPVFQRKKGFERLVKSISIESLESAGRLNKYRNKL